MQARVVPKLETETGRERATLPMDNLTPIHQAPFHGQQKPIINEN
jgi:hypothetical protein